MTRDRTETYIGEQFMKDFQFVIRAKDFLLDPNTIEVRLDEAYIGVNTLEKVNGKETYQGKDCALDR